jgi:type I restriction-modification system DNA methylase subunit
VILSDPFDQKQFLEFIEGFLPDFNLDLRKVEAGKSGFTEITKLGEANSLLTSVLIVKSKKNVNSRISLTNNSFKILKAHQIYRAVIVYVNEDDSIWRLSLLTALPTFDSTGKVIVRYSNPRRHSYVLGTDTGVATARKYLSKMGPIKDFEDLQLRFSVEAVNKDFYAEISDAFYKLVGHFGEDGKVIVKPILKLPGKDAQYINLQNYAVRLIGRILFLWFLKQKRSTSEIALLPAELLDVSKTESIFHDTLEPLFFEILNKPIESRLEKYKAGLYGFVPYLNGGLFQPVEGTSGDFYNLSERKSSINIPNEWLVSFFNILNIYNFTIDENLKNDIDLSIDPEMLGRVFENLLAEINPITGQAARKITGSYYTPREIVSYMVDETLLNYLVNTTDVNTRELRAAISTDELDDLEFPMNAPDRLLVVEAIRKLKVFDPACGSGAFPMGMLQKIVWVLEQIDPGGLHFLGGTVNEDNENINNNSSVYQIKRSIIKNSIFGVDIQPIAVEISRLRCFLTLIVEQEIVDENPNRGIDPLPNLDFKFVCANSLILLSEPTSFFLGEDSDLEIKLRNLRNKYFDTQKFEKKNKIQKDYITLVSKDPTLFGESKRTSQLKSYQPFQSESVADFFDPNNMFGISNFDIVISNPPYIHSQDMVLSGQSETREIVSKSYKYAKGNWDIYIAFFERGLDLLSPKGTLSYITPDKWLSKPFGDALRIGKMEQISSILIAGRKVFTSAIVDSIITLFSAIPSKTMNIFSFRNNDIYLKNSYLKSNLIEPFALDFLFSEHLELLDRLSANTNKFESIATCENACGTNDAYLLKELIHELMGKFNSVKQMRLVNTGTIGKFQDRWGVDRMTYLGEKYLNPVVNRAEFVKKFPKSYSVKSQQKKLIVKGLNLLDACIDEEGAVVPGIPTLVVLANDSKKLAFSLGLLNSKLAFFYIKERYPASSYNQGTTFTKDMLNQFPIPKSISKIDISRIGEKAMEIVKSKRKDIDSDTSLLEGELNKIVFDLYQLTPEDRSVIEGNK